MASPYIVLPPSSPSLVVLRSYPHRKSLLRRYGRRRRRFQFEPQLPRPGERYVVALLAFRIRVERQVRSRRHPCRRHRKRVRSKKVPGYRLRVLEDRRKPVTFQSPSSSRDRATVF